MVSEGKLESDVILILFKTNNVFSHPSWVL
jgi:hypothetical protein